jgi:hypothetical protein
VPFTVGVFKIEFNWTSGIRVHLQHINYRLTQATGMLGYLKKIITYILVTGKETLSRRSIHDCQKIISVADWTKDYLGWRVVISFGSKSSHFRSVRPQPSQSHRKRQKAPACNSQVSSIRIVITVLRSWSAGFRCSLCSVHFWRHHIRGCSRKNCWNSRRNFKHLGMHTILLRDS